jgi:hypothetical protein
MSLEQQLAALDEMLARVLEMIEECPPAPTYCARSNDK